VTERLRVGISPCPNDTYVFSGLMTGESDAQGFDWDFELLDVQELNSRLDSGLYDCAKGSFAAALGRAARLRVLPVGAALGFGVGPLLLSAPGRPSLPAPDARVLCPGEATTATLLYESFHPGEGKLEQVLFSEIMPALERGDADYGVCIHEGRFTWRSRGLACVEDLGERWERECTGPLPLGGLFVPRRLDDSRCARIVRAIRASIDFARAHPLRALEVMRKHAQEHSDEVIWDHVELYVNDETYALSAKGRDALARLQQLAQASGRLPDGTGGPGSTGALRVV
jgi:1,4-dihydroxy-6-naphthoate synthase